MFSNNDESGLQVNTQWQNFDVHNEEGGENEELPPFIDEKALRMMKLMGYKSGSGLGKNEQGITSPVEVKNQLGTRGLGLYCDKSITTNESWDFSLEDITVEEKVNWLNNTDDFEYSCEFIKNWAVEGAPLKEINDQIEFCNSILLKSVMDGKNIFDELDLKELNLARARANPFETIRSVFFMNRAALKMANIDAATDFMFTNIDQDMHHNTEGPIYFADVCAGPGGFTEYILWRKKWYFKGYGFTLRGEHDFKLGDTACTSPVTFQPFYGAHDDGDICCPDNIADFKQRILHETVEGVHFMMSDGGFSVEGNENIQEILSKNIYLCQCLTALEIVRVHGHFVTKMFDVFTRFSIGLIYLMYKCFEKVAILKPNSSRPANSERYLICCNLKSVQHVEKIKMYLWNLAVKLWQIKDNNEVDINEIVPLDIIKKDQIFYSYLCNSNNSVGRKQSIALKKLAAFCRNSSLIESRQEELRRKCLEYWKIPDIRRIHQPMLNFDDFLALIDKKELLISQPRSIFDVHSLKTFISDVEDWHYTTLQCNQTTNICNFYAGVGPSKVYRLQCNKWVKVKNLHLVPGSFLYGELVKEQFTTIDDAQLQKYSLHVIDALRLGESNVAKLKFEERHKLIQVYCKAINHESRMNAIRIRAKIVNSLQSFPQHIISMDSDNKYLSSLPVLGLGVFEELYGVNSILLMKTNDNQFFHSTYILRLQCFLSDEKTNSCFNLENFTNFIAKNL